MKMPATIGRGPGAGGFGCWVDIELPQQLVQLFVASCASSCWRHWSPYYRPLGNIGEHIFSLLMSCSGGWKKQEIKGIKGDFMKCISLGQKTKHQTEKQNWQIGGCRYDRIDTPEVGRPGIFHAASALAVPLARFSGRRDGGGYPAKSPRKLTKRCENLANLSKLLRMISFWTHRPFLASFCVLLLGPNGLWGGEATRG